MKWAAKEVEIIKAHPGLDAKELAKLLPGRSHEATQQKRARLGIHYIGKKWTAVEEQYVREHQFDSVQSIAGALNRPEESVIQKRVDLGARRIATCTGCGKTIPKRNQHVVCSDCAKTDAYYNSRMEGRYRIYRYSAKKRGHLFDLSLQEFETFANRPCTYCGDQIEGVGIDRVDNDQGYTKANCCPCCETCNRMKLEMSVSAWMAHMKKIISRGTSCA